MNQKEWTIMVYMAGDNNLAVDMAYAMEQIKEVAGKSADKLNLLVYYDGSSPDIPTLYCDFSDPNDLKYVSSESVDSDKPYPVPKKHNENSADTKSILNFVDWCVTVHKNKRGRKAKKYALIFSGHSLGFADKGLFKDETTGKSMKIENLYYALARLVVDKAEIEKYGLSDEWEGDGNVLIGQPLDILGFDSCLMGMFEVGYQFYDVARTMLVSEGSIPSAGWSYAKILTDLCKAGDKDVKYVARDFVKKFIKSQDQYIIGGISVDIAAWDMRQFRQPLGKAVNLLSQRLIECFGKEDEKSRIIYRQMERIVLQVHWKCQSYMFDQNVDLGDFCELLKEECESVVHDGLPGGGDTKVLSNVIEACQAVLDALKRAVILSGFSGGEYQYSNGVSLFFPWSLEAYEVSKENYQGTWYLKEHRIRDNEDPGWGNFLEKYLTEITRRDHVQVTAKKVETSERHEELRLMAEDSSDSMKYVYESGVDFYEQPNSSSPEVTESQMAESDQSESSVRQGGSASSVRQGGSGSSVRQGGSGSSVRQGGSGSSVRQGGSGSSVRQGGSGSSVRQGGSGSSVRQGGAVGGGADGFFNALKLRKNIEVRWDISGFTKKPEEEEKAEKGEPES
ncbi:MAG: clostripain-related cysteine peptidase [Blastocatellia bacterium]